VDVEKINDCFAMAMADPERTAALCELLQLLGTAAILVDREGEVVGLNDAARDCIGAGIQIRNRRLVAADPEGRRALAELIDWIRAGHDGCARHGEQVVVARRNLRPLILRTVPLHRGAAAMCAPARAIVLLLDPGRMCLPAESQLKRAFALSDGEARLTIRLAAGQTLAAAATLCGISYETARKRLKIVFEKTDTCRQSELVALIIRLGALAGVTRPAAGETMRPRPPHPSIGTPLALQRQLPQPQAPSDISRWRSTA
jgi:DNA-binding CsgD family transcriptional regulator